MDDTNIGNSGLPKQIYDVDLSAIASPSSQSSVNASQSSTISQSNQSKKVVVPAAGTPQLIAPIDVDALMMSINLRMNQISAEVGRAWGKSLEEMNALREAEMNSPAYRAKEDEMKKIKGTNSTPDDGVAPLASKTMWLNAISAVMAGTVPGAQSIAPAASIVESNKENVKVGGIASVSVASSTEAAVGGPRVRVDNDPSIGSDKPQFVPQSVVALSSAQVLFQNQNMVASTTGANALHTESKVVQDAWSAVTKNTDPATLLAGGFSAMVGVGLVYQLSAEKVAKGTPTGKNPDMDFAKNYASKVLAMVDTPNFTNSLQAMLMTTISKTGEIDPTSANFNALISKAKLVLLSLALALVGKLEVGSRADEGWINEKEFDGMLDGTTDLAQNDPFDNAGLKSALVSKINVLLASLDPADRADVRASLRAYMSRNPSVENLLDQQTAVNLAMNPPHVDDELKSNLAV